MSEKIWNCFLCVQPGEYTSKTASGLLAKVIWNLCGPKGEKRTPENPCHTPWTTKLVYSLVRDFEGPEVTSTQGKLYPGGGREGSRGGGEL